MEGMIHSSKTPAAYEDSFFPTSLPTPVGGSVYDENYSNRVEVES
jgi:hypothetical protein